MHNKISLHRTGDPLRGKPILNFPIDLVAHRSKNGQGFIVTAFEFGRILKRPVQPHAHARENRAFFFRVRAYRDQVAKMLFPNKGG